MKAWESLQADLSRYLHPRWSFPRKCRRVLVTKEIWVIWLFRWGSYIYDEAPAPIAALHKLIWWPWNGWVQTLLDTHLLPGTRIGPGLYIGHHGGIWINPGAVVGARCNLAQGIVVGAAGGGRAPILGDRVWVGPHAVITGPVNVGNDAVIGANSLIVVDVPDKAVMVGVPAKILSYSGSAKLVRGPEEQSAAREKKGEA